MDKEKNAPDLMRYDLRIQEALRGAVRSIMNDIARTGFPGDHHFYVSFRTRARGVQMSERLRKQYPDEMTIVLQHQFWDLVVGEKEFSVGLSFKQVPEKLVIPFDAISSFVDPTVHFALKFEVATESETPEKPAAPAMIRPLAPVSLSGPSSGGDKTEPLQETSSASRRQPAKAAAQEPAKIPEKDKTAEKQEKQKASSEGDKPSKEPGKIVSIDAFRKKT